MSHFKAKMHQIRFRLGLCPRPCWGSLQCSPDPLAGFEGAYTSKGGEGREKGSEREGREGGEGREEGRGGEGGEGKGEEAFLVMWPRRLSALNPPLRIVKFFPASGMGVVFRALPPLQNCKGEIKDFQRWRYTRGSEKKTIFDRNRRLLWKSVRARPWKSS